MKRLYPRTRQNMIRKMASNPLVTKSMIVIPTAIQKRINPNIRFMVIPDLSKEFQESVTRINFIQILLTIYNARFYRFL